MLSKEVTRSSLRTMSGLIKTSLENYNFNDDIDWENASREYSQSLNTITQKLKNLPNEETLKLFREFEESSNALSQIETDLMYYRGMIDTIEILKFLKVI